MRTIEARLLSLGEQIRARRVASRLTQDALGKRAGIVGKYVSEIERGTRDVPISTLLRLVEQGLGLRLELVFVSRNGNGNDNGNEGGRRGELPPAVEDVAREVAALPVEERTRVLAILRSVVALVTR